MIYSVYTDDVCIYSSGIDSNQVQLIEPKLTLEDNCAGSFEFTMPPDNNGYSSVTRLSTTIQIFQDGVEIWEGRPISDDIDFWNNRRVFAEGALAYLNDSIQPMAEYHNVTPLQFLTTLLNNHNANVDATKQIFVGTVTVTDPNDSLYRYTNYESTLQCINEKLIDILGGHLRLRKVNGIKYLDYLADYPNVNTQVISFGYNLVDFTRSWDATDYATVILPLGAALEESPIDKLTAYTTVESVNGGSPYVVNSQTVASYGWICKVEHWDDVEVPANLLSKAREFLTNQQFDVMTLEMTAADLHGMSIDTEAFKILDLVRCVSPPHGMDRYFPVKKMEIMLDAPESTSITLGENVESSLTTKSTQANAKIAAKLAQAPPVDQALLAQAAATAQQIANGAVATIGGWTNSNGMLYKNVGDSNNLYKYFIMPPSTTSNAWVIGFQKYDESTSTWKTLFGITSNGTGQFSKVSFGNANGALAPNIYAGSDTELFFCPSSDPATYLKLTKSGTSWALLPHQDAGLNLGLSGNRWNNIYAANGTIITSDLNDKYDIRNLGDRAEQLIMGLKPVSFKMKDGTSRRDHLGFIAQDVEQLILDMGLTTKEFGGIVKSENEDGSETYGLRYDEFIAPLVQAVQNLRSEVDYLLKHI